MERINSATKLIVFVLILAMSFSVSNAIEGAALLAIIVALSLRLGIGPRRLLRPISSCSLFFLTVFLMNAFFTPSDDPLFSFWILSLSAEGAKEGIAMIYRLVFAMAAGSLYTSSSTSLESAEAVRVIFHPLCYLGIPVDHLAQVFAIAIQFVPVLSEESRRIIRVQKARGVEEKNRIRLYAGIVIPVFISAFRKADELAMSMEARGYSVDQRRSIELRISAYDAVLAIGTLLITIMFWRLK